MEVQKYIIYQNSGLMDDTDYVTLFTLGQVLRKTVVLLSLTPDVSLKHHDSWENKTTVFIWIAPNLELAPTSNKRPS